MSACFLSVVIIMSQHVVPSTVAQHIVKFLANENMEPAEIMMRPRAQFSDETFSRTHV